MLRASVHIPPRTPGLDSGAEAEAEASELAWFSRCFGARRGDGGGGLPLSGEASRGQKQPEGPPHEAAAPGSSSGAAGGPAAPPRRRRAAEACSGPGKNSLPGMWPVLKDEEGPLQLKGEGEAGATRSGHLCSGQHAEKLRGPRTDECCPFVLKYFEN